MNHQIETASGSFLNLLNPDPHAVSLEDVAHALGQTCRYGGHSKRFYSVAEHAVFVSQRLEGQGYPSEVVLAGLHHDDHEAYVGDVPTPLKSLLGPKFHHLAQLLDEVIIEALGLPYGSGVYDTSAIKRADEWALLVEARHLVPSRGLSWSVGPGRNGQPLRIVTPSYWYGGLDPKTATHAFISRHKELTA